ncbi:phosphate signaling complex protein PhoU [Zymomonas mobilis]|uniref:phosphate signaling complex protein PhoU n=1 Tax=Zymomonas mobilis TaxID=542 RepID=UPI0039EBAB9C
MKKASEIGHTVKAFDEDLGGLRALICEMGGLTEIALTSTLEALIHSNKELAAQIVEKDKEIDALEIEAERVAMRIISLRAPLADDLRDVIAAMKISGILERMADYAKNIAKRVPILQNMVSIHPVPVLPVMGEMVSEMVRNVLDAYAARDPKKALHVAEYDMEVDGLYNNLFRILLTYTMEDSGRISTCIHLMFIAKNLERIGDHATNIAEMVYFAATGKQMPERTRGKDLLASEGS